MALRLGLYQFAPRLRAVPANAARIATAARDAAADLLLTPELSLTGYGVGDEATALSLPLGATAEERFPVELKEAVVVGLIERGPGGLPYNTAAFVRGGDVVFRHRKIYLPTYGMFDEGRFFARGRAVRAFDLAAGWRAGILVCEDLWHPALPYLLACQGIDLLLVQAAAPGRGVWEGGNGGGRFASWDTWRRIGQTVAQLYGIYFALANRTGAEGGLVFAGGSFVVAPDGRILREAPADGEHLLTLELDPEEAQRARRPYAHLRDEDPGLVYGELGRILGAGARGPGGESNPDG